MPVFGIVTENSGNYCFQHNLFVNFACVCVCGSTVNYSNIIMPKPKDPIWNHFQNINKAGNTGKWAICKTCKKEMQGIPSRMKEHRLKCSISDEEPVVVEEHQPQPVVATPKRILPRM